MPNPLPLLLWTAFAIVLAIPAIFHLLDRLGPSAPPPDDEAIP